MAFEGAIDVVRDLQVVQDQVVSKSPPKLHVVCFELLLQRLLLVFVVKDVVRVEHVQELAGAKLFLVETEVLARPLFCEDLCALDRGELRIKAASNLNHLFLALRQVLDVSKQAFAAHEGYVITNISPGKSIHELVTVIGPLWKGFIVRIAIFGGQISFVLVIPFHYCESDLELVVANEHGAEIIDLFLKNGTAVYYNCGAPHKDQVKHLLPDDDREESGGQNGEYRSKPRVVGIAAFEIQVKGFTKTVHTQEEACKAFHFKFYF